MRILVTGSSGLVGGAIASHLTGCGHQVVGLGRRLTKENRALAGAVSVDLGRPGVASVVAAQTPRCEAIVHTAAAIDGRPFAPEISTTNCVGTQQVLELADRWAATRVVYISSIPVIGRPTKLPVTEEHPTNPPTAYHASKLFGEQLLRAAGLPGIALRLSAPVGPGMPDGRILPAFVRSALAGEPLIVAGEGSRGQDYVDVRDIAASVLIALERGATGTLNIASGRCVTNLELARRCVKALDSTSAIEYSGDPDPEEGVRWEVSIERALRVLGYRPRYSLEDSIEAVAAHLSNQMANA
jgi:dTDP-glucose 4,6-dehydratase